jgi:hypothetical protein
MQDLPLTLKVGALQNHIVLLFLNKLLISTKEKSMKKQDNSVDSKKS